MNYSISAKWEFMTNYLFIGLEKHPNLMASKCIMGYRIQHVVFLKLYFLISKGYQDRETSERWQLSRIYQKKQCEKFMKITIY